MLSRSITYAGLCSHMTRAPSHVARLDPASPSLNYLMRVIKRGRLLKSAFIRSWRIVGIVSVGLILFIALALQMRYASASSGAVNITTLGTPFTQNFDTLPASGSATWTNNSTIPGWYHARTGTGTTIVANNGSSNAGNLYSYGTGTATDRALGSVGSGNAAVGNLFWGVRLCNLTGATVTSLDVSYTGEQWRNSAAAAQTVSFSYVIGNGLGGALADFQSAGTAVTQLDFTGPVTGGSAAALDGNLSMNRVSISFTIGSLSLANGQEILLRWSDPDHTGADHGMAIDDFSVTGNAGPVMPSLSINDAIVTEGDSGTTTATFTVSLSSPAGPGGVTFDIATADGTAQDDNPASEDNDYVANSLVAQTIPPAQSTYTFNVLVNGDTTPEANETFFVNVTNISGATPGDTQGQGTINNDDVTLTPIHDIQGPGAASPLSGSVSTRGIVTGVKTNGFFIQEPDASVDADPLTSEGIFVFTSSAPPAPAMLGNLVQVTGTISEFIPSADPLQPPLTELTGASVVMISSGNPLPAAIPLSATFPDPAGAHDQLERLEGMRVSAASLTVVGPTLGNVNEPNATATSTGIFFGVITGVARPFREPGIQAPDPAPMGSIPPIPRFDANPERIRVDSDGLVGGTLLDVRTGAVVTGLIGPLDFGFRNYTILPDPGSAPAVDNLNAITATPVTTANNRELTVASYNLERFFDTVNDPGIGEPVLTAAAFNNRLNKASLGIRNFLKYPDILGVVEVENLTTLQALAARITSDALANSQPDPLYEAFLVEGNDVGGIDVGFLVKKAIVSGSTPRVSVTAVVQENAGELFVNPDSSTELLNDRPSLRLMAVVNHPSGASFPVTVIVNHLRSLNDVESTSSGSNGWATLGERVRAKRLKQAESLANVVQARQTADPNEHIILVGDFNAFEFNDGFGDSMNVIQGTPPPDNQTVVPGDGADLVNPDLTNLFDTAPATERYSFVFDGNAQSLDHILINQALMANSVARRVEHPRINADFSETARNVAVSSEMNVERLADHDPIVGFFEVSAFATADLSAAKVEDNDPATAGTNLTYTITLTNNGPEAAANVTVTDAVPANTTFVSANVMTGTGWTTMSPTVGGTGNVVFSKTGVASSETAVFTIAVNIDAGTTNGTVITNSAVAASDTTDPNSSNNTATTTTTVNRAADLAITKTDSPDPVTVGSNITYTINFVNNGPSDTTVVAVTDAVPANTTFVSAGVTTGTGWTVMSPSVGGTGNVVFSKSAVATGESAVFSLVVAVNPATAGGTMITNNAVAAGADADGTPGNNTGTATTTVAAAADLAITKGDGPDPVIAGTSLTYTISFVNNGPSSASSLTVSDPLPAGTNFASAAITAGTGWSTASPSVGSGGTVTFSKGTVAAGETATFTIVVNVSSNVASGAILTNTATASSATVDNNPANDTATATTTVQRQADLMVTKTTTAQTAIPGGNLTYTITVKNNGPSDSANVVVTDPVPLNTTFVSAAVTSGTGWTITAPLVGGNGNVVFSKAVMALNETAVFTLVVKVNTNLGGATQISNQVTVVSDSADPTSNNNAAAATISLFDVCIFDPAAKKLFRFSRTSGVWQYFDCAKGTTLSGQGVAATLTGGCKITLIHPDPRSFPKSSSVTITATANICTGSGTATLVINGVTTTLNDPNVNDGTCSCQ